MRNCAIRHFVRWRALFDSRMVSSNGYWGFDILAAKNPMAMHIIASAATIHGVTESRSLAKIAMTVTMHRKIPPITLQCQQRDYLSAQPFEPPPAILRFRYSPYFGMPNINTRLPKERNILQL